MLMRYSSATLTPAPGTLPGAGNIYGGSNNETCCGGIQWGSRQ